MLWKRDVSLSRVAMQNYWLWVAAMPDHGRTKYKLRGENKIRYLRVVLALKKIGQTAREKAGFLSGETNPQISAIIAARKGAVDLRLFSACDSDNGIVGVPMADASAPIA